MDAAATRASGLAIGGGRLLAVGSDDDVLALAGPRTVVEPLDGRVVLPGLVDPHNHLLATGALLGNVELYDCRSIRDVVERIAARVAHDNARRVDRRPRLGREPPRRSGATRPGTISTRSRPRTRSSSTGSGTASSRTRPPSPPAGSPPRRPSHRPGLYAGGFERDPGGEPTGLFRDAAKELVLRHVPALRRGGAGGGHRARLPRVQRGRADHRRRARPLPIRDGRLPPSPRARQAHGTDRHARRGLGLGGRGRLVDRPAAARGRARGPDRRAGGRQRLGRRPPPARRRQAAARRRDRRPHRAAAGALCRLRTRRGRMGRRARAPARARALRARGGLVARRAHVRRRGSGGHGEGDGGGARGEPEAVASPPRSPRVPADGRRASSDGPPPDCRPRLESLPRPSRRELRRLARRGAGGDA